MSDAYHAFDVTVPEINGPDDAVVELAEGARHAEITILVPCNFGPVELHAEPAGLPFIDEAVVVTAVIRGRPYLQAISSFFPIRVDHHGFWPPGPVTVRLSREANGPAQRFRCYLRGVRIEQAVSQ